MASSDPFDQASQNIDAAKLLLNQATAKGGSAATDAYNQAIAGLQANKQAALQQAMQAATARGTPQENLASLSGTISAPVDRSVSFLNQAAASRAADIAQRGANSQANLSDLQAAIPAIRGQVQARVDANTAKAAAQQQRDNLSLALAQMRLQQAQAKTASPSSILSSMGGAPALNSQLDQITPDMAKAYQADFAGQRGGMAGPGNAPNSADSINPVARKNVSSVGSDAATQLAPAEQAANTRKLQLDYAEALGRNNGLAPGQASGIYATHLATLANQAAAATKAADTERPTDNKIGSSVGLSLDGVRKVRTTPQYSNLQQAIRNFQQQGINPGEIVAKVRGSKSYAGHPKTAEVALRDFLPPAALSNTYSGP